MSIKSSYREQRILHKISHKKTNMFELECFKLHPGAQKSKERESHSKSQNGKAKISKFCIQKTNMFKLECFKLHPGAQKIEERESHSKSQNGHAKISHTKNQHVRI